MFLSTFMNTAPGLETENARVIFQDKRHFLHSEVILMSGQKMGFGGEVKKFVSSELFFFSQKLW